MSRTIWVIEYLCGGSWLIHDKPMVYVSREKAEKVCQKRAKKYLQDYQVTGYARLEGKKQT